MLATIQRVSEARVSIEGKIFSEFDPTFDGKESLAAKILGNYASPGVETMDRFFVECERAAKFGSRRGQIYTAIKKKKRVAYISKRWRLIAFILKIAPASFLKKMI